MNYIPTGFSRYDNIFGGFSPNGFNRVVYKSDYDVLSYLTKIFGDKIVHCNEFDNLSDSKVNIFDIDTFYGNIDVSHLTCPLGAKTNIFTKSLYELNKKSKTPTIVFISKRDDVGDLTRGGIRFLYMVRRSICLTNDGIDMRSKYTYAHRDY